MFFSFVIPTYNRASLIGKTIQTLLNQSYQNFEVIVVDDGSTDNSEEVVNAFDPSKVSFHKIPNCERGAARNYGAKISKGDYINFFDSDDLAYPHHLQTALDLIQNITILKRFICILILNLRKGM
ncbi:MAG: glycosyltransferase family 2 protein [Bacteroidetes bacterium]|nr:glycosyltransferase family 2 protein [Bacteroidota bacterium]